MKHKLLLLAIAAMMLALLLAGCGKDPTDDPNSQSVYDDSLIGEIYSEEGSATDTYSNTWNYSYHIPQILAETPGAKSINQQIAAVFDPIMEEAHYSMDQGWLYTPSNINWQSHWNGSLLSLVIAIYMDNDYTEYCIFNYDFEADEQLDNEQLLAIAGLSREEFLTQLRAAAINTFDDMYGDIDGSELIYDNYIQRSWTIGNDNISMDGLLYLNDNGQLEVAQPIGSIAGASWYYQLITVNAAPSQPEKASQWGPVRATLEGGEITIDIEDTPEGADFLASLGAESGTYLLQGAYNNYSDIFVGPIVNDNFVYLFLLTEDGHVEYADISMGLQAGYLVCGGRLAGIRDIVSFEARPNSDNSYAAVFAVDSQGQSHELTDPALAAGSVLPYNICDSWGYSTANTFYFVDIYPGEASLTIYSDQTGYDSPILVGNIAYLGMTQEGMVYYYNSYYEDGYSGALLLNVNKDDYMVLDMRCLTGRPLLDSELGKTIQLIRSAG